MLPRALLLMLLPGAAAFGDDGGELLGDAARVTLCNAAASASRVKRGCA